MSLIIFLVPAGLFSLNFKLEIWTRNGECECVNSLVNAIIMSFSLKK